MILHIVLYCFYILYLVLWHTFLTSLTVYNDYLQKLHSNLGHCSAAAEMVPTICPPCGICLLFGALNAVLLSRPRDGLYLYVNHIKTKKASYKCRQGDATAGFQKRRNIPCTLQKKRNLVQKSPSHEIQSSNHVHILTDHYNLHINMYILPYNVFFGDPCWIRTRHLRLEGPTT